MIIGNGKGAGKTVGGQRLRRVVGEALVAHAAGGGAVAVEGNVVGIGRPLGVHGGGGGGGVAGAVSAVTGPAAGSGIPAVEIVARAGGVGQRNGCGIPLCRHGVGTGGGKVQHFGAVDEFALIELDVLCVDHVGGALRRAEQHVFYHVAVAVGTQRPHDLIMRPAGGHGGGDIAVAAGTGAAVGADRFGTVQIAAAAVEIVDQRTGAVGVKLQRVFFARQKRCGDAPLGEIGIAAAAAGSALLAGVVDQVARRRGTARPARKGIGSGIAGFGCRASVAVVGDGIGAGKAVGPYVDGFAVVDGLPGRTAAGSAAARVGHRVGERAERAAAGSLPAEAVIGVNMRIVAHVFIVVAADRHVIAVVVGAAVDGPAAAGAAGGGVGAPVALDIVLAVQIRPGGELHAVDGRAAVGINISVCVITCHAVAHPCVTGNDGSLHRHVAGLGGTGAGGVVDRRLVAGGVAVVQVGKNVACRRQSAFDIRLGGAGVIIIRNLIVFGQQRGVVAAQGAGVDSGTGGLVAHVVVVAARAGVGILIVAALVRGDGIAVVGQVVLRGTGIAALRLRERGKGGPGSVINGRHQIQIVAAVSLVQVNAAVALGRQLRDSSAADRVIRASAVGKAAGMTVGDQYLFDRDRGVGRRLVAGVDVFTAAPVAGVEVAAPVRPAVIGQPV